MIPNMFKIAGELTCDRLPRRGPLGCNAGALDLRRPFRRDGDADHRFCAARFRFGAGGARCGADRAGGDAGIPRVPFLHFFDGFRTSHEVNTLTLLSDADIRAMIDEELVRAHRARALNPEHPFIRGTAHNPDTFFQARETVNPFYAQAPDIVQAAMDQFAGLTGRAIPPVRLSMAQPDAERVVDLDGLGRRDGARNR